MQDVTRPLTEPGSKRGLRRRLVRHYLPLVLTSAVVLLLFMTLPRFESGKQVDIFSGRFPKAFPAGQSGQHDGGQSGPAQEGPGHQIPPELLERIPKEHRGQIPGLSPTSEEVDDRPSGGGSPPPPATSPLGCSRSRC